MNNNKSLLFLLVLFFSASLFSQDGAKCYSKNDETACEYAKKSNSLAVWEEYLATFSQGSCVFLAQREKERIVDEMLLKEVL